MQTFLKINPKDQVAVALKPISAGITVIVDEKPVTLLEDIPQGHKFALCDIPAEASVIKYGSPIGIAKENISMESWVHTHNLKTGLGNLLSYTYEPVQTPFFPSEEITHYFQGYRRPDGKVGVRNEIWIIPTVGCVNNIATSLERQAQTLKFATIDAIAAFPHPYGCSQMGDDQEHTRLILADLINHPNAGGVLVLGLGCENSNVEELKRYIGTFDENRVKFLVCQESKDEMTEGIRLLEELAVYASTFKREPIPCSVQTT